MPTYISCDPPKPTIEVMDLARAFEKLTEHEQSRVARALVVAHDASIDPILQSTGKGKGMAVDIGLLAAQQLTTDGSQIVNIACSKRVLLPLIQYLYISATT